MKQSKEELCLFEDSFRDLMDRWCVTNSADCIWGVEDHIIKRHIFDLKEAFRCLDNSTDETTVTISFEIQGLLESIIPSIAEAMFFAGMEASRPLIG